MWSFPAKYIIDHSNTTPNIDHPFIEPNHQYHKLSVISVVTTSKPTLQQTDPTKREGALPSQLLKHRDPGSRFQFRIKPKTLNNQKQWQSKSQYRPKL